MIRKSAFIIIAIAALIAAISFFILGDSFVEDVAEFVLNKNLQTEVKIEGLDVDLANLNVSLEKIQIKDPDNLDQDLATTGGANFDIMGMQLLAKKLVVNEMSVTGITVDSELSKLKSEGEGEVDKGSLGKLTENLPDLDLDVLAEELDVDEYVHPEKLKSVIAINQAEEEGHKKIAFWNEAIDNSTIDDDISKIQFDINKLRNAELKTVPQYQAALEDLKDLKKRSDKTTKEISDLHRKANNDLKFASTQFGDITSLTEQDIRGAEKLANITEINASHIGMMLFGKEVVLRYQKVMDYLNVARRFFSDKKQKPKRKEGRTINFPVTTTVYPEFLIQNMAIEGLLTEQQKPAYKWGGSISDLALEQDVSGKSTVFDITGDEIGKKAIYNLTGILDNRNKSEKYSINLKGTQLDLGTIGLRKDDKTWPNTMKSKDAELVVEITLLEESIEGIVLLTANSVQFSFKNNQSENLSETDKVVRNTFRDMKSVQIKSKLEGTLSNPGFTVSSNVDAILAQRLDDQVGQKIEATRKEIRDKIQGEVDKKKNAATKRLDQERVKVLAKTDGYKNKIDEQKEAIDSQVSVYQKKIKEEVEKQKKGLEDKVKNQLKNFFN